MRPIKFIACAVLLLAGGTANAEGLLADGGFEAPVAAGDPATSNGLLTLSGTVSGWTYSNAGVVDAAAAAPFFSGAAPTGYDGNQYAFIRGTGSISQTVVADTDGFFSVAFQVAGNPGLPGAGSNQTIDFLIDGVVIQTASYGGGTDFFYTSDNVPTLAGVSHTITFNGLSGGDDIAFLDSTLAIVTKGSASSRSRRPGR